MRKKILRNIGLLCVLLIAVAAVIGYRMYNKPHRSAATEDATSVTAHALAAEYEKDEAVANKKYLGQALQVTGTVSDVSVNQQRKQVVVLTGSDMSSVQCTLAGDATALKKGDPVTIRGFCAGFLTDVVMDRCIIMH